MYYINLDENYYLFKNISLARLVGTYARLALVKPPQPPADLTLKIKFLSIAEEWGDKYRVTHLHATAALKPALYA